MSTAAKVGAFFLVALVLTGLMIWKIEDLRFGRAAGRMLTIEFDNVAGLRDRADVRLAGVRVGRVSRIRLVGARAVVDLEISADVALREGASAAIESLGMLGDKFVELEPGPAGGPPLREGVALKGETPVAFDQITKLARDIELDIRDVTRNLKDSLQGASGEERLKGIVDNVFAMSRETRKLIESNRSNIDVTTANFREFSTEMTKLVERIDKLVASNQGGVTQTVDNARELTTKLQATVDNMNAITGRIRSGEGTLGKLVKSEETDKNLNDALVSVKDGVKSLTSALDTVKKWNIDLGLRSEYLTRFEKAQSYFTLDVLPKDKPRFYRFELSNQPFGVRRDTTNIYTITFPDGHTETVKVVQVEYKDRPAISAEVGFRLGQFTGRAGVIESTGGIGLDYATLKNRLQLSAQLWNFDRDQLSPQAKLTARYYFSPSVFVTGGWNDFLNTKYHLDSAFAGLGIRWGDDDVKYLAGSVPIH
jgi:phospholipid/cholesterol/gamma-HCH transport system substrate-binding protein